LEDDLFDGEKLRMTTWNKTIAAATLLAALCPAVALAQAVEYVDDQGQKLHVGANPPDSSRRDQLDGTPSRSSQPSSVDGETAGQKAGQSKADKEFADQQRDAVRKKAPEKTKQVCRWGPGGAPPASNNFSVSRSCQ
jgi:hypothetical protein